MYPTYLQNSKGFSDHNATVATIIGNCVSTSNKHLKYLLVLIVGCHLGCHCVRLLIKFHDREHVELIRRCSYWQRWRNRRMAQSIHWSSFDYYVRPSSAVLLKSKLTLVIFNLSIFVLLIGAFIPLWILPTSFSALAAGAFCIQFGVQGAWGVVRILSMSILRQKQLLISAMFA